MHCEIARNFWLYWDEDVIRIGEGNIVLQKELISYSDTLPHMDAIGLRNGGTSTSGVQWEYGRNDGVYFPLPHYTIITLST